MRVPSVTQVTNWFFIVLVGLIAYNVVTSVARRYGGTLGRQVAGGLDAATGL